MSDRKHQKQNEAECPFCQDKILKGLDYEDACDLKECPKCGKSIYVNVRASSCYACGQEVDDGGGWEIEPRPTRADLAYERWLAERRKVAA